MQYEEATPFCVEIENMEHLLFIRDLFYIISDSENVCDNESLY
jgi:hypothetical protein